MFRFSTDSKKLFYVSDSWIYSVDLFPGPPRSQVLPTREFPLPDKTSLGGWAWDTLPDGGFIFAVGERPIRHHLVFNWLQDVDQRLDVADDAGLDS